MNIYIPYQTQPGCRLIDSSTDEPNLKSDNVTELDKTFLLQLLNEHGSFTIISGLLDYFIEKTDKYSITLMSNDDDVFETHDFPLDCYDKLFSKFKELSEV